MTDRPEGWYLDPDNPRAHRYWDGRKWGPAEPSEREVGSGDAETEQ